MIISSLSPSPCLSPSRCSVCLAQIPGAMEHGITSDDIFWLKEAPGKTYASTLLSVHNTPPTSPKHTRMHTSTCTRSTQTREIRSWVSFQKSRRQHDGLNLSRHLSPPLVLLTYFHACHVSLPSPTGTGPNPERVCFARYRCSQVHRPTGNGTTKCTLKCVS